MFINNFDPVAFEIFSLEIRWYSLSYIIGLVFGWYYAKNKLIKDSTQKEYFDDYITYLIISIIIGGRLGYVIIYDPIYFISNPIEIIKIWQGGMSFHGALVGIIIGTYFFCKNKNQNIFNYLDVVAVCSPIGIFLGRISNFINSELYGIETNVPWSVKFIKIDDLNRHPSQIYEAIFEGIILFIILSLLFNRLRQTPGIISGYFLILYSFFRFVIEFFREPDQQLGYLFFNLSMGQIISCITLTCGLIIIYYKNANRTQ
ncbi:prolipoprotein diacylglyceryl transferase [Candidatus Pelagibacter sp.]|nr:prolipoprotein diacylglyceryl transferase [Candidatus Pelagibacter sp.]